MIDETQVIALVQAVLHATPLSVTRMPYGHNSETFDVALPHANVMVRINAHADVFAGTVHNLNLLRGLGLPVPGVLVSNLSKQDYPFAFMILEKIPGRDLRFELPTMSHAQMTRLAERIVGIQRLVSTLPSGETFGYVPIGQVGRFATWDALVRHEVPLDAPAPAPAPLPPTLIEHMHTLVDSTFHDYLAAIRPVCFLDDITTKNVIMHNGELRGLVDFDCVCYGDPLFMIGLTAAGIVSDVGVDALFYVDELCRVWNLTEQQCRVVSLYSALFATDFMRRAAEGAGQAWTARMTRMIDAWVRQAEQR